MWTSQTQHQGAKKYFKPCVDQLARGMCKGFFHIQTEKNMNSVSGKL